MRQKPADLMDHFSAMEKRVSNVESSRRMGFTSFDAGFIRMLGSIPEIRFEEELHSALTHGFSEIFAFYYNTTSTSLSIDNERIDDSGNFMQEGGKVQLATDAAVLSHFQQFSGLPEAYVWLGAWGIETIEIRGRFPEEQTDGRQAILTGTSDLGAGFGSFTYSYLTAYVDNVYPVVTLLSSGGTVSWNLTAQSTSSWTVTWTGTTAKTFNYWIVRGQ